jgi:hypothetical protein
MSIIIILYQISLLLLLLNSNNNNNLVTARYPPQNPPFVDECMGIDETVCNLASDKGQCIWSARLPWGEQYPWCFSKPYALTKPKRQVKVGISTKFFIFNAGVHLSEGTHQKFFYNLTPDECAAECLQSAALCPFNVRCLSFDFYPFEIPKTDPPWNERYETGMCVLNNQNKDSARLRNSDLGWTDAQLFYRSHFSYLPFADSEGYYEVRDSRGVEIGNMLDYGSQDTQLPATNNVWGGSRWGIFHYSVPRPVNWVTSCPIPIGPAVPADDIRPRYYGGYTPVDENQKCPGLSTFDVADELCLSTGGRLCHDEELVLLRGRKLGCGFDGPVRGTDTLREYPIWSETDRGKGSSKNDLKYPRCCANYAQLDSCGDYKWDQKYMVNGKCLGDGSHPSDETKPYCPYSQCSRYTKATDCVNYASGSARQLEQGMGIFLDEARQNCTRDQTTCKGVIQDWKWRDSCVWCPAPGAMDGGGAGECRVGTSLAICPNAPPLLRKVWAYTIRTHQECEPLAETTCRLIQEYPDLASDLLNVPLSTKSPTTTEFIPPDYTCVEPPQPSAPSVPPGTHNIGPTSFPTPSKSVPTNKPIKPQNTAFPTPSINVVSGPSVSLPPTIKPLAPTFGVLEPCYSLLNLPKICDSRSDCVYDSKHKLCLKRQTL